MKSKTNLVLSILLPVQWKLVEWLSKYPEIIETYYSKNLYPRIASLQEILFGWLSFSIGDLLYVALGAWSLFLLYKLIKEYKTNFIPNLLRITALLSCLYFAFHFLWALNYYRPPLYQQMKLEAKYSKEELIHTTEKLLAYTNALHADLTLSDSVALTEYSKKQLRSMSVNGYSNLTDRIHTNNRLPKSIKNSSFSLVLSYLGYGGYYNPFTGEAQINAKTPKSIYAVIAAHEQAHQLGYAAENEANFIGILASMNNPDKYIQFTGASYSLRYCLNEVARHDMELYKGFMNSINPGVLAMYTQQQEFWEQYESVIEDISKNIWDKLLKASKQEGGIASYNYMVALIVNYNKAETDFLNL